MQRNTAVSFPSRNIEMLTGTRAYAALGQQILDEPPIYAQISAVASVRHGKSYLIRLQKTNFLRSYRDHLHPTLSLWIGSYNFQGIYLGMLIMPCL